MVYVINRQRTKCFQESVEMTGRTDLCAWYDDQDDRPRCWVWTPSDSVGNSAHERDIRVDQQKSRMEKVSGSNPLGCRVLRRCMDARRDWKM